MENIRSDEVLPAVLATIDLQALRSGNIEEKVRLSHACEGPGFFYLRLSGSDGSDILKGWGEVLDYAKSYVQKPLEVKLLDAGDDDSRCYKPAGIFSGVEHGRKDNFETVKILRSALYNSSDNDLLPADAIDHKPLLERFMKGCDSIATNILSALSDSLETTSNKRRLESAHRTAEPSKTFLGILHYPSNNDSQGRGHNRHTDLGSLTILLASQPGLQVLSADGWRAVEPKPNCAVVNVGDTLHFLSDRRLRSCVHRVDPPAAAKEGRFSLCYFLRAENSAVLNLWEKGKVTAGEWHDRKFRVFRQDHVEQAKDEVLTGGMESGEGRLRVSQP